MSDDKLSIFDILNDISHNKKCVLNESNHSQYNSYMINRWLSMNIETIMYAQEMNCNSHLPKDMQYDYHFYAIKKQKRFFKYIKHHKQDLIDLISEYHSCSEKKAKEMLNLFSEDDISYMKDKLNKGGKNAKR
ncbi:MAG: DNA polymerase clamp loader subunit A [Candidatus Nanopelagicaceae bacterium]